MFISRNDSIKLRYFLISILLGTRCICYEDTHQGSFSCKMPFSKDARSCKEVSNFICRSDAHACASQMANSIFEMKDIGCLQNNATRKMEKICDNLVIRHLKYHQLH